LLVGRDDIDLRDLLRNVVYSVVKWHTCIVGITSPAVLIWPVAIIVVVITIVAIVVVAIVVIVVVIIWPVVIQKWIPVGHMSFIGGMLLCPSLILI